MRMPIRVASVHSGGAIAVPIGIVLAAPHVAALAPGLG
jgi:hypothetical protein